MSELNEKITEMKLEEIRVYLSKFWPNLPEETRESALGIVVESFYSRNFHAIKEANKQDA